MLLKHQSGSNIHGEGLHHHRFADDIVFVAGTLGVVRDMNTQSAKRNKKVGLIINFNKTKSTYD